MLLQLTFNVLSSLLVNILLRKTEVNNVYQLLSFLFRWLIGGRLITLIAFRPIETLDEEVFRLNIAMNNPPVMNCLESAELKARKIQHVLKANYHLIDNK